MQNIPNRKNKSRAEYSRELCEYWLPKIQAAVDQRLRESRKICKEEIFIEVAGPGPRCSSSRWVREASEIILSGQRQQLLQFAFQNSRISHEERYATWAPIVQRYLDEKIERDERITVSGTSRDIRAQYPGFPLNLANRTKWLAQIVELINGAIALQSSHHTVRPATSCESWECNGQTYRARLLNSDDIFGKCPYTGATTKWAIQVQRGAIWVDKMKVSDRGLKIAIEKAAERNLQNSAAKTKEQEHRSSCLC